MLLKPISEKIEMKYYFLQDEIKKDLISEETALGESLKASFDSLQVS